MLNSCINMLLIDNEVVFLRRSKKNRKKLTLKSILFLLIFIYFIIFVNVKLKPSIYKKCELEITKFASNQISNAITQTIEEYGYNYDDYVKIQTASDGNIIAIFTNARQITTIHNAIINKVNDALEKFNSQYVYISSGSLSGIVWLSSRGPNIPIKISSKGHAKSEIVSSLQEAGINQTLHKIHINVEAIVVGFLPFHSTEVKANSSCMLSESLIVGKVPQHYTKLISKDNNNYNNNKNNAN